MKDWLLVLDQARTYHFVSAKYWLSTGQVLFWAFLHIIG